MIAEVDSSGRASNLFAYGAAGLAQRRAVQIPQTYSYTFDPSGNPVQRHSASTSSTATVAEFTCAYDAFGQQLGCVDRNSGTQATDQDMVGFGGQFGGWTDNETDAVQAGAPRRRFPLVRMGYRDYAPLTGRFVERDPIDYSGGINLYAYAGNNPITHADPSGLQGTVTQTTEKVAGVILKPVEHDIPQRILRKGAVQTTEKFALKRIGAFAAGFIPVAGQLFKFYQTVDFAAQLSLDAYTAHLDQQNATFAQTSSLAAAMKARSKLRAFAQSVTSKYNDFECTQCAAALIKALKKKGIEGKLIRIEARDRVPFIYSFKVNTGITETGFHVGVQVGDLVFDNIHKSGIHYAQWVKDFDAMHGIDIFR